MPAPSRLRLLASNVVATFVAWLAALGMLGRLPFELTAGDCVLIGGTGAALAAWIRAGDPYDAALWTIPLAVLVLTIGALTAQYCTLRSDPMVLELALPTLPVLLVFALAERAIVRRAP